MERELNEIDSDEMDEGEGGCCSEGIRVFHHNTNNICEVKGSVSR